MKISIALLLTAFAFGCATTNKTQKVVQTKSGRTIAQAGVAPGKKINFYSCKSGLFQNSQTIDKSKCTLVSDMNIGTAVSQETNNFKALYSYERVLVHGDEYKGFCEGEDFECLGKGNVDWAQTSLFLFNEAQSVELGQKLKEAYANNKGASIYFNKRKPREEDSSEGTDFYELEKAHIFIESN